MAKTQDELEIKFRLTDGSDIGPKSYSSATSVAALKENVISQWPKGGNTTQPRTRLSKDPKSQARINSILNNRNYFAVLQQEETHNDHPEKENGPRTVKDVKIISAGKILENNRTLGGECRSPICNIPGSVTTMHVVVQAPLIEKGSEKKGSNEAKQSKSNQIKCVCTIL